MAKLKPWYKIYGQPVSVVNRFTGTIPQSTFAIHTQLRTTTCRITVTDVHI